MDLNKLRIDRGRLIEQARGLVSRAEGEKRDMSQEEQNQFDELMKQSDTLAATIQREERLANSEREISTPQPVLAGGRSWGSAGQDDDDDFEEEEIRDLVDRVIPEWLSRSRPHITRANERHLEKVTKRKRTPEVARGIRQFLRGGPQMLGQNELRALQSDIDVSGGYLRPDQNFLAKLIIFVNNLVYVRQLATVMTLDTADSIGAPSLDTDVDDSDWTNELGTGNEDSAMAFGRRVLRPHPLAKRIKVSKKLLRQNALDVEALVRDRLGYKFAVTQEKAFMSGTGQNQPLGVFTADSQGISTGRDVSTGNTTTAIQADGLIEAKYTLKPQYWPKARWIFHRDGLKAIRKLKDGDGQYLWQPGLSGGMPDTILDSPFILSEYAPNTFTTGLYVGIYGDFSFYWIVDTMDFMIQVLTELYATSNQNGYIARAELDAMPVLEEAFVRVTLA